MIGAIRSTVIMNPDGRIAHRWKRTGAEHHAAQVIERLEKLRADAGATREDRFVQQ